MKAADCSWRTSSGRMPSLMQEDSASSIGPPIRKNRMSVPSFLSERARISEPVNSAMVSSRYFIRARDRAAVAQVADLVGAHAEPFLEHLFGMLAQQRRRSHRNRRAAEAHRPGRHLERSAGRMLHHLHDAAVLETLLVLQLHRIEHGPRGYAGGTEDAHRLALVALAGPGRDHGVDLRLPLGAGLDALEIRIADEIGAPDRLEQRVPMRRIGAAGVDVAIVVRTAGLARIDPARH